MLSKALVATLLFLVALSLQIRLGSAFGGILDLALISLVVAAFFVKLEVLLFLVTLGALALNWQPAASAELALFAGIPLFVFFFRQALPWQTWLNAIVSALGAIAAFYLFSSPSFVFENGAFVLWIGFLDMIFGFFLFSLFNYFHGEEAG